MINPVGEQLLEGNGRSPDANQIYEQFLAYYNDINTKIHAIDCLPYDQRSQPNVQQDRADLVALQKQLYTLFESSYSNPAITLADFQNACAPLEAQVLAAYNDAIGGSNIQNEIEQDYENALAIINKLNIAIGKDQSNLNNLITQEAALENQITSLQSQIDALPNGQQKTQAQKDLKTAEAALTVLKGNIGTAQSQLTTLQGLLTTSNNALAALQKLSEKKNPTESDLDQANSLEQTVVNAQTYEKNILQPTLSTGNQNLITINNDIVVVQKDLSSIQNQIQQEYINALNLANTLNSEIIADQGSIVHMEKEYAALEKQISSLQSQINALSNGTEKTQAQADLNTANAALVALENDIDSAQTQLGTLQGMYSTITGYLTALQSLSNIKNPTEADLTKAAGLLSEITTGVTSAKNYEQTVVQAALATVTSEITSVKSSITVVQNDLNPPTPGGKVEHGCWYIDWTSWGTGGYPIPENVNTINIFVGNMSFNAAGQPVIGGFGDMSSASMTAFIKACHARGIAVKFSIGGSTSGSYGYCWNVLTQANVASFAQALVNFCLKHGGNGIDFDCEEFTSGSDNPAQQALVGTLIKDFKEADPQLETSLCTNAGFGPYFPWQGVVENILNAASYTNPQTGKLVCAVGHMYIMSYYNTLSDEEAWITGWANLLETKYNFAPQQITVGIDNTDANAYDIKVFAAWAANNNFSTCYWEWNPNTAASSNASTTEIIEGYNAAHKPGSLDLQSSAPAEGKIKFPKHWRAEFGQKVEEAAPAHAELLPSFAHEGAV